MGTLPRATTTVQDTATAQASGQDLICILAPVPVSADITPRQFGSAAAAYAQHGYSEGVEYAAHHVQETGLPFLFVGLPISTAGVVGRVNTGGNTGSSSVSVAAGGSGVLGEHDGVVKAVNTFTIGSGQGLLDVSLDGGKTFKRVRLGTANSYVIPFVGVTLSFGAGGLVAGDTIITWHGTAPRVASADITTARTTLASQLKFFRSILLIGDLQNSTEALAFDTELRAYATANDRFVYGRASIKDRAPLAALSATSHSMTGSPSLTFETSTDTVTRSSGSWAADGFAVGDVIEFDGSDDNDAIHVIESIDSATVLTVVGNLVDEGPVANVSCTGQPGLAFANTGETITRNRGSWLADGFRVGDTVVITGTDSGTNDGSFAVTAVTALVLTLEAGAVDADESSGVGDVSITAGQTKAAWMAASDAAFAAVDAKFRIDLSAGRARMQSPFSDYWYRRPAAWAASCREYQHDLHISTWRKADGPCLGDLFTNGVLTEWDDRVDGGAGSAARFTTFRTWSNGPAGAFIAQSLTRESDASILSQTHNVAVTNVACTIVQLNGELAIGESLVLNADGTATEDSISTIEKRVNDALERGLLANLRGEGQRASLAVYTASRDDVLNVPEAVLNGVTRLNLRGTIHSVITPVKVLSGGAQ